MKIRTFFITATLALFAATGFFASNNRALAADCAAQIADTKKQYAASRANFKYSEKLAGKIDKILKKARKRLDQGKKKFCLKLVKKARAKIAYRENKAKAGGKRAGKGGKNKAKCAAELKAAEKRLNLLPDNYDVAERAERFIGAQLSRATSFMKEGKYKKCQGQIKKANAKMDFYEGR